ncbi:MAG: 23S rRNA (pseudouridine(1915)-N(3))-methyltransferase RlmH [Rhodospirillaceae bacterium]|nr:MAG: 23S rRNA (pseudouridine(1915)-N(3))-methyltransferase RlmH [Rhodospirillaceae bacterium]
MAFAIHILAVGRARQGPEGSLFDTYARRMSWPITLEEVDIKAKLPPARRKAMETAKLLSLVPAGAIVVALDAGGTPLSSEGFADRLCHWRDEGTQALCLLIGGADGLDRAAFERANFVLSLGPMIWPHLLVRTMLAEQLYRAQQILLGHPYHRGAGA